jgi:hypothetical protein
MLHVKLDLNVLIRFYVSRFNYMTIGSDLQRSGAAWLGQEVSLGFALAARAVRLQLALPARGARSRLACACSFCKKYMNSYMITAKNI